MKDIKALLENIDLFSSLNEEELAHLASISKVEHYSKKSIVFYEHENLSNIYYLLRGKVKLYKIDKFNNEIFLSDLTMGNFIYLIKNTNKLHVECKTFYSVETLEESDVLLIDIEKFKKKFLFKYEILEGILNETYKMMQKCQYIINRDLVYDGTAKIAHMLCNSLDEFNSMKKNDIAYRLHVQPETLSRIVKKLQNKKLIAIEQKNVTILNRPALEDLYK
jgi:CRP/FNR family transcriptional regulator